MAISYVTGAAAAGNTAGNVTCQPGDIIIVWAYRDGGGYPTAATGFDIKASGSGTTSYARVGYKYAQSTTESTGVWTNATGVVAVVYRGAAALSTAVFSDEVSATLDYPAGSGNYPGAWFLRFAGHRSATNMTTNAPSTSPNTFRAGVATEAVAFDSNGAPGSNPAAGTQSVSASSGWTTCTVVLFPDPDDKWEDMQGDDFDNGTTPDASKWLFSTSGVTLVDQRATIESTSKTMQSVQVGSVRDSCVYFQVFDIPTTPGGCAMGISLGGLFLLGWWPTSATQMQPMNTLGVGSVRTHTPGDWYRIRESGGTCFWDASVDGETWTTYHSEVLTPSDYQYMRRSFPVFTTGVSSVGNLVIDNFNTRGASGGAFLPFF